jgi:predicted RNA methylase
MDAERQPATLRYARRGYLWARSVASRTFFDGPLGVDTTSEVALSALGLEDAERVDYEPSGWLGVRRALARLEVRRDDVFLDLGSGKGRVVLQAAQRPFRRVIGVELAGALHDIARQNVGKARPRLCCREVELVHADVTDYRVPDDVTVVYMCNPFRGGTFDAATQALIDSVDRAPRTVRLIYQVPTEHDRLLATGRFRLTRTARGRRPTRAWSHHAALHEYELEAHPCLRADIARPQERGAPAMSSNHSS